jgi:glutathione synthase
MRIGFVVNNIETEEAGYTTTRLARAALNRGHETWVMGVGDFAYDPDDQIRARARTAPGKDYKNNKTFFDALRSDKAKTKRISVSDLDVLMLRNDPAEDKERPWAMTAGIVFGELAADHGVLVLNDPSGLADALNKMYFQHFPEQVRPRTLITRDPDEVRKFVAAEKGKAALKPLLGSGGQNVFVMKGKGQANLSQMVEAITRDGYLVAQEYLPEAKKGDIRLFVMNGRVREHNGKCAAFRRVGKAGETRNNMSAGGKAERCDVTDEMRYIVDLVRPKLIKDGMFLVGLDIVGNKLMEINVFSPGGFGSAERFTGVDFSEVLMDELERKVALRASYHCRIPNNVLATM